MCRIRKGRDRNGFPISVRATHPAESEYRTSAVSSRQVDDTAPHHPRRFPGHVAYAHGRVTTRCAMLPASEMLQSAEAVMLADVQPSQWSTMIEDLVRHYTVLWHDCDTSLPWLGPLYARSAQRSNERRLDHFLATVSAELKGIPQTSLDQQAMWARIDLACRTIARVMPGTDERAIDTLLTCGFREASVEFARMA